MTHEDAIARIQRAHPGMYAPGLLENIRQELKAAAKEGRAEGLREAVVDAAKQIADHVGVLTDQVCPHGNSTTYPGPVWYCDDCWDDLNAALTALEAQGKGKYKPNDYRQVYSSEAQGVKFGSDDNFAPGAVEAMDDTEGE